jgi:hypothetical protein
MSLPVCKELVKISMENVNLNPSNSSYKYPESELSVEHPGRRLSIFTQNRRDLKDLKKGVTRHMGTKLRSCMNGW